MRPRLSRFSLAAVAAVTVSLAGFGTATAMTADSGTSGTPEGTSASSAQGIKPPPELLPPPPIPLPQPVKEVVGAGTDGGSGGSGATDPTDPVNSTTDEGATGPNPDRSARHHASRDVAASKQPSIPTGFLYRGSWRFFDRNAQSFSTMSGVSYVVESRTVSAPAPVAGTVRIARVSSTVAQTPAYLWVLLPLGSLAFGAAAYAVFEPIRRPGRVLAIVGSLRQSAQDLPPGMARTAGRRALSALRGLRRWQRR